MKIGACAKVTPDTDTRIKINADASGIDPAGIKWIVSPYDAFAIEEAIRTKEAAGGEVMLFTAGDKEAVTALRGGGLAVGADALTQISDAQVLASDALGVARALAAAVKAEGIELLFCGKQAIDDDNSQVPAMIAELLGWPLVTSATTFEISGNTFKATRGIGGGIDEVVSGSLPAVITCDKGLNSPRYAKLPDIMKAKKKPVHEKSAGDLGLSAGDIAPAVTFTGYSQPPARAKGRILEGDTATAINELVRLLREEAKVI